MKQIILFIIALSLALVSCKDEAPEIRVEYDSLNFYIMTAYIPPYCYSDPVGKNGLAKNKCYICHTNAQEPNYISDLKLQERYEFPDRALVNPWKNILDSTTLSSKPDVNQIQNYIRESNYIKNDKIILYEKLKHPPAEWEPKTKGKWRGFTPDLFMNPDKNGFDRDPTGSPTGWVALPYYPFPEVHWPRNSGSYSEVYIRLPDDFRKDTNGRESISVYSLNLAIYESLMKKSDVAIPETDERIYHVDLNKDGKLTVVNTIRYDWAPLNKRFLFLVGKAGQLQKQKDITASAGLLPKGTEYIQVLYYLDVDSSGNVIPAARIKEIRYSKKVQWIDYGELAMHMSDSSGDRRRESPNLRKIPGNHELGVYNGVGWAFRGFIEDKNGDLRPQSHEELTSCVGCHGGIGAGLDSGFTLQRKMPLSMIMKVGITPAQNSYKNISEPVDSRGRGEYSFYLKNSGSGVALGNVPPPVDATILKNGQNINDISHIIVPDEKMAYQLNQKYIQIVKKQSFIYGRMPAVNKKPNLLYRVDQHQKTGLSIVK